MSAPRQPKNQITAVVEANRPSRDEPVHSVECRECCLGLVEYMFDPSSSTYVWLEKFTGTAGRPRRAGPVACDCNASFERGYLATYEDEKTKRMMRMRRVMDMERDYGFQRCDQTEAYCVFAKIRLRALTEARGLPYRDPDEEWGSVQKEEAYVSSSTETEPATPEESVDTGSDVGEAVEMPEDLFGEETDGVTSNGN